MKIKTIAIFIMISSIFSLLSGLFWIFKNFDNNSDVLLISNMLIITPISFLLSSIALMNIDPISNTEIQEDIISSNDGIQNLSVGDWVINFLITIIPLVGLIFIIIWANDDKNKIRKNWAKAILIWGGIVFLLSIFLYLIIFAIIMKRY